MTICILYIYILCIYIYMCVCMCVYMWCWKSKAPNMFLVKTTGLPQPENLCHRRVHWGVHHPRSKINKCTVYIYILYIKISSQKPPDQTTSTDTSVKKMCCHPSWIINYHQLSSTIINYHQLSSTTINFKSLVPIHVESSKYASKFSSL